MNHRKIRNTHIYNVAVRLALLCVALLAVALQAPAVTKAKPSDNDGLYQQLVNGNLQELKKRGTAFITENPDSSVMYLSAVAARYADNLSDDDKETCIGAINNLAYVYFYSFNNPLKSYDYLLKALKLSEENGFSNALPHIYLNMANVFAAMGESQQSLEYLKKSIHASTDPKAHYILVISFIGLLNQVYVAEISDLRSCSAEIEVFNKAGINPSTELYDYARLMLDGIRKSDSGDYTGAINSFEQARKTINSKLTPERDYFVIGSAIARAQMLQGNVSGAIRNLHEILYKTDAPDIKGSVYNQLSESFQKIGNIDSTNYYSRLYLELSDSILHRGQLETLRGLDNQYMTDKLNAHIEKAARDRQHYFLIFAIGSAAFLIILALGVWAFVSRRRLVKANKLLYEKSRQDVLNLDIMPKTDMPKTVGKAEGDITDKASPDNDVTDDGRPTENTETGETEPEEAERDETEGYDPELMRKITEIFSSSPDVLSQEFSLERLAYLAGTPLKKVSRCLNDAMGTNFINEVQKRRIREACRLFEDGKTNSTLTIMAISDMVGFKSRSNFVQVFKKITGLTPSQYQKMSRER